MQMGERLAVLLILLALLTSAPAAAQNSEQNIANDPLTPKAGLFLQDYFQPLLNGQPNSGADQILGRGVLPHETFGIPQLARVTVPVAFAWGPQQNAAGLGDTTIFDVPVFHWDHNKLGIGPLLVLPTSTSPALGPGKWQWGGQVVASSRHDWGLTALYVSYQQSFVNTLQTITAQPFIFFDLPNRFYLRSTGIATFNLANGSSVVPVGFGLGRVFELDGGKVLNVSLEPQYSVIQTGPGVPSFQIFVGFNFQFPVKAPPR